MYIAGVVLVLVVLAGLAVGREIVRSNYYVSEHAGTVSILRGVQGSFLGISLQEPYLLGCLNARNELSLISAEQSRDNLDCRLLSVDDMRPSERAQVIAGLPSGTLDDAIGQIEELAHSSVLPVCAPPPSTPKPAPAPSTPAPSASPRTTAPSTPGAPETPARSGDPRTSSPTPAPETPRTVTSSPTPPPPSPSPSPSPTVTALPPPPPEPGTNCRELS